MSLWEKWVDRHGQNNHFRLSDCKSVEVFIVERADGSCHVQWTLHPLTDRPLASNPIRFDNLGFAKDFGNLLIRREVAKLGR